MLTEHLRFVEDVIARGSRIREHTVFAHLPPPIVKKVDALVKKHPVNMARGAALWFVLTGNEVPRCATCADPLKFAMWLGRKEQGYTVGRRHCCCVCAGLDNQVQEKRSETNNARYGVDMPQQNKKLRERQKRTMVDRYGVAYSGQNPESMAKTQAKLQPRRKEIAAKSRATHLRRYGVVAISQLRDGFERSQAEYHLRETTVDSKTFRVRGYEPQAIEILHRHGVKVENILTTAAEGVPSVPWHDCGKDRVYHPDFKVKLKGRWTLIEVKSDYTCGLKGNRELWRINKKKFKACADQGLPIKLMVVHKERAKLFDNPHLETVATLRAALGLRRPLSHQP